MFGSTAREQESSFLFVSRISISNIILCRLFQNYANFMLYCVHGYRINTKTKGSPRYG